MSDKITGNDLIALGFKPGKALGVALRLIPGVSKDLDRQSILRELQAVLAELDGQMKKPLWPSLLSGPIPIDHPLGVKDKPTDEYVYWDN